MPTAPASPTPPPPDHFIVRTFYTDSSLGYVDWDAGTDLRKAIARAAAMAEYEDWRTAVVTDGSSMVWAQFNMLWMVPK